MTVILACVTDNSVHIGGDRILVFNSEVMYGHKVVQFDSCLAGFSGTRDLYTNVLRNPPPVYIPENYTKGFNEYVSTTLHEWGKSGVFDCINSGAILGFLPPNEPPQLVGISGEMGKNWFNIEVLNTSISSCEGTGSGSEAGRIAFDMLSDRDDLSIEEKMDRAIRAVCKVHLYARPDPQGNIDILSLQY